MNKKAQLNPFVIFFLVVVIGAMIYCLAIVGGFFKNFSVDFNDRVQDSSISSETSKEISNQNDSRLNVWLDSVIFFVLIIFWLGCVFLASQFNEHPALFIIILLGLIFVLTLVGNFEDMYSMFASDNIGFSTYFPLTHWIMSNLTIICMVMGGTILLAFIANVGGYL